MERMEGNGIEKLASATGLVSESKRVRTTQTRPPLVTLLLTVIVALVSALVSCAIIISSGRPRGAADERPDILLNHLDAPRSPWAEMAAKQETRDAAVDAAIDRLDRDIAALRATLLASLDTVNALVERVTAIETVDHAGDTLARYVPWIEFMVKHYGLYHRESGIQAVYPGELCLCVSGTRTSLQILPSSVQLHRDQCPWHSIVDGLENDVLAIVDVKRVSIIKTVPPMLLDLTMLARWNLTEVVLAADPQFSGLAIGTLFTQKHLRQLTVAGGTTFIDLDRLRQMPALEELRVTRNVILHGDAAGAKYKITYV